MREFLFEPHLYFYFIIFIISLLQAKSFIVSYFIRQTQIQYKIQLKIEENVIWHFLYVQSFMC